MVSAEKLIEYYNSHTDEYPVAFTLIDNGVYMAESEDADAIAYLDGRSYEVYPGNDMPYTIVYSLKEDAETIQLDYDEDDAKKVLDAFVDCTYLRLFKLWRKIERTLKVIEGRSNDED